MIKEIGKVFILSCQEAGKYVMFSLSLLRHILFIFKKKTLFIKALYFSGVLSMPIIMTAGFFVGMVLAFQGYTTLVRFGAENSLGIMVALSLMRELGSVVSALLFAGRAGSAITAEIALMKTTEQITALEMMGLDPKAYIAAPRLMSILLSLPLLTFLFVFIAVMGAYMVGVLHLEIDNGIFWNQMRSGVDFYQDLIQGTLLKSLCFAMIIATISIYQGFASQASAQGVAEATTKTVVYASLAVLGMDFVLTSIMFGETS